MFIFKSLSHFELIFVYGVWVCSDFIDLHITVQLSQHHLPKRLYFLWCIFLPLCWRLISCRCVGPVFYLFQCHILGLDLHHLLPAHCTGFLTALPSWSTALPQAILYTYLELLLTASYLIRWTELPTGHTLDTLLPGLSVYWFSWPVSSNSSNSYD